MKLLFIGWIICFIQVLPILWWYRRQIRVLREQIARSPNRVGNFEKFAFPIISRTYPRIIAEQLISVQPMTRRLGTPADPYWLLKREEAFLMDELASKGGKWRDGCW